MGEISNFWTIIFILVSGQGIFLSIFLLFKTSKYQISNIFLAILLLLFSFNLIENVAYWTGAIHRFPHLINTTLGFIYLYGALFYVFIHFRLNPLSKLKPLDFLHVLPFLIFTFVIKDFFLLSGDSKLAFLRDRGLYKLDFWTYFWQVLSPVLLLTYSVLSYVKAKKVGHDNRSASNKFIFPFALFSLLVLMYVGTNILLELNIEFSYIIMFAISVFIYQIGYLALAYPNTFDPAFHRIKSKSKYEKSSLTVNQSLRYLKNFEDLMESEKLFIKQNLKINEVADRLSISTNHLSQTLNLHKNQSFVEIVNYYRINEAKKLLLSDQYKNLTIEGIAMESGFSNKTSFNRYFKKHMKVTPSEFKKGMT